MNYDKTINLRTLQNKMIAAYLNPLADDLIKDASRWRYVVFDSGDLICTDAFNATHQDMLTLVDDNFGYPLSVGGFEIKESVIVFGIIQQGRWVAEKGLALLKKLIPMEVMAQGRELVYR